MAVDTSGFRIPCRVLGTINLVISLLSLLVPIITFIVAFQLTSFLLVWNELWDKYTWETSFKNYRDILDEQEAIKFRINFHSHGYGEVVAFDVLLWLFMWTQLCVLFTEIIACVKFVGATTRYKNAENAAKISRFWRLATTFSIILMVIVFFLMEVNELSVIFLVLMVVPRVGSLLVTPFYIRHLDRMPMLL